MGFRNDKEWEEMEVGRPRKRVAEEIRILGYRLNRERNMTAHLESWKERGVGVKERIASAGRRYRGRGGIGAWESYRLLQGVYLQTVQYGLGFLGDEEKSLRYYK